MNPLGAFSFGQIIKTLIPGLIASGALVPILELMYRVGMPHAASWRELLRQSFTWKVILQNPVGFVTLLFLSALMLGFLLNTCHWFFLHACCDRRCLKDRTDEERKEREAHEQRLQELAKEGFAAVFPGTRVEHVKVETPAFFLARVDFEKFLYLRESYFAWYEFQMNSLAAVAVLFLSVAGSSVAAACQGLIDWISEVLFLVASLVVLALVIGFLWKAALRNLAIYKERLLWFLVGTLDAERKEKATAGPPAGLWAWF